MSRTLAVLAICGCVASSALAAEDVAKQDFWREVDRWEWDSSRLQRIDALRRRQPALKRMVEEHGRKLVPICEAAMDENEKDPSPGQRFYAFMTLIQLVPDETAVKLAARRLKTEDRPERWLEEDALSLLPADKFTSLVAPIVADRQVSLAARWALYQQLAAGGDESVEKVLKDFQAELRETKTPELATQAKAAQVHYSVWKVRQNEFANPSRELSRQQALRFHRVARLGKAATDEGYFDRAFTVREAAKFDGHFLGHQWTYIDVPELEGSAKTALAIGAIEGVRHVPATLERLAANPDHASFAIRGLFSHHSEEAAESLRKLVDPQKPQEWAGLAVEVMGINGGPEMIEQVDKWLADPACKLPRESLNKARDELRQRYKR